MKLKNSGFIQQILDAVRNANSTQKSLEKTLDEIVEEIYWKGAKEQNKQHDQD